MPQSATVGVLLDHAQAKIALVDENECFTYVNAASEGILGVTPEQLVGENAFDRTHQDDVEEARRTFRDVTQRKQYKQKHRRVSASGPRQSSVWKESRPTNFTDSALDRIEAKQRRPGGDDGRFWLPSSIPDG